MDKGSHENGADLDLTEGTLGKEVVAISDESFEFDPTSLICSLNHVKFCDQHSLPWLNVHIPQKMPS